jgi:chromate reductase
VKDGLFDGSGDMVDPDIKQFVQGWIDRYAAWVKRFATQ